VPENVTPSPFLGPGFLLADGLRVRLRLARSSDVGAIAKLFARHGQDVTVDELAVGQVVQFDPRRRYAVCATALIDSTERLIGVGAIDLDPHEVGEPDLLVVDPDVPEAEVGELLWDALVGAAQVTARGRAA
jgi:N-acetylglutamate synthase-like GNAT family acetyltransferase